jgi:hypothetical protein
MNRSIQEKVQQEGRNLSCFPLQIKYLFTKAIEEIS